MFPKFKVSSNFRSWHCATLGPLSPYNCCCAYDVTQRHSCCQNWRATCWLKMAYFSYPSLISSPAPYIPLEFRSEVNHEETTVMGLLSGESCMILTSSVFDW